MTNNKQQTVVEQFAIVLYQKFKLEGNGKELNDLVEQAKEMEKERMIEFSEQVFRNRYNEVYQSLTKVATDTYNETYGGGEQ
jgi:hypothetical protein